LVVTLLKSEIKYKFSKTREEFFTPFFFIYLKKKSIKEVMEM